MYYNFSTYYLKHSKIFIYFEGGRDNSLNNFLELWRKIKDLYHPKYFKTDKF